MTRALEGRGRKVSVTGLRFGWWAVLALLSCLWTPCFAQVAHVVAQGRALTGETTAAYVEWIGLAAMERLADSLPLPGDGAASEAALSPDGRFGVVLTVSGTATRGVGLDSVFYYATPYAMKAGRVAFDRVAAAAGVKFISTVIGQAAGSEEPVMGILSASPLLGEGSGAWFTTYDLGFRGRNLRADERGRWALPGMPVALALLRNKHTVVILSQDPGGSAAVVEVRDLGDGRAEFPPFRLGFAENHFGTQPVSLRRSLSGKYAFVLVSGYSLADGLGRPTSWVHAIDLSKGSEIGRGMMIPGVAHQDDLPLKRAGHDGVWAATFMPGTDFAYATGLEVKNGELAVVRTETFTGTQGPMRMAPSPSGEAVATAYGNRLAIRGPERAAVEPTHFLAPIETLVWGPSGLFAGEGGRFHEIDVVDGTSIRSVQLGTGFVTDIHLGQGKDVEGAQGMGQGSFLSLPADIVFRGEAVGAQVRTLMIDGDYGSGAKWSIEYDRMAMPWLRLFPTEGGVPGEVTLGIDPALYPLVRQEAVGGLIRVRVKAGGLGGYVGGSPADVRIHVSPARNAVRRILWVRERNDLVPSVRDPEHPLSSLANVLAAPPHLFSHHEVRGGLRATPDRYSCVVLSTRSAAQGALTRQTLLDYVAAGGAIVLLGDSGPLRGSDLNRWFAPMGLAWGQGDHGEGSLQAVGNEGLLRHWAGDMSASGPTFRLGKAVEAALRVTGASDEYVFAAFRHGLGRVALFASATPLENTAMAREGQASFAGDLFRWLSRALREIEDRDGDGLPDSLEDANNNGIVEAFETDYLEGDTDGDGVPDGHEDLNRNGRTDDDETSPLNPDSDGDGIFDGADAFPLPPKGAPVIDVIEPGSGPSEGGTLVILNGRNFTSSCTVWFGERRSPQIRRIDSTKLVALTPPLGSDSGGAVSVRARSEETGQEGLASREYEYTPRSVVTMSLKNVNTMRNQYAIYGGLLSLRGDVPEVVVGPISLVIRTEPAGVLDYLSVEAAPDSRKRKRRVTTRQEANATLRINVTSGNYQEGVGEIAHIRWSIPQELGVSRVRFIIESPVALGRNGAVLGVSAAPLTLELKRSLVKARRLDPKAN